MIMIIYVLIDTSLLAEMHSHLCISPSRHVHVILLLQTRDNRQNNQHYNFRTSHIIYPIFDIEWHSSIQAVYVMVYMYDMVQQGLLETCKEL